MRDDTEVAGVGQRVRRALECAGGHIDQMCDQRLRRSFDQRLQLAAVARPELDETREPIEAREDRRTVTFQEPRLRARDRVPRQLADRVE